MDSPVKHQTARRYELKSHVWVWHKGGWRYGRIFGYEDGHNLNRERGYFPGYVYYISLLPSGQEVLASEIEVMGHGE